MKTSCDFFKLHRSLLTLVVAGWLTMPAIAQQETPADRLSLSPQLQTLADMQLMLCFQGKGSFLSYDGGVVAEASARIPAIRDNKVIVSGNSSGSILAAFFACHGFNDQSLQRCEDELLHGDDSAIRAMEQPGDKALKMMRKEHTELEHDVLNNYIAFALGVRTSGANLSLNEIVRRSKAKLRLPLLIVACNREVLQNCPPDDLLRALNYKVFDPKTFSVSWKPEVYQFYRTHPERFARDCPDLRLGPTPYIGKAVTYFVDRSMYDLLRQIPAEERTADLRLVETPADIAAAILASVSEPTYFFPSPERDPQKLLCGEQLGELGNIRRRSYCGGFLVSMPGQDVRRMLPELRILGTGWTIPPVTARKYVQTMYLADMEQVAHLNCWWADMELSPAREVQQAMVNKNLSPQAEFDAGRQTASRAFSEGSALPLFVAPPPHPYPADTALPVDSSEEVFGEPDEQGRRPLKTLRGLGPLLTTAQSAS